ncbi:MAG: hypothetical protein KGO96_07845 [Elusimicrobia bacterium]|nr:hypothetical protein [Elusimicrobiota bacterium]MDE2425804.1 hypothetical protein [Elusimicrobiota bacterium]
MAPFFLAALLAVQARSAPLVEGAGPRLLGAAPLAGPANVGAARPGLGLPPGIDFSAAPQLPTLPGSEGIPALPPSAIVGDGIGAVPEAAGLGAAPAAAGIGLRARLAAPGAAASEGLTATAAGRALAASAAGREAARAQAAGAQAAPDGAEESAVGRQRRFWDRQGPEGSDLAAPAVAAGAAIGASFGGTFSAARLARPLAAGRRGDFSARGRGQRLSGSPALTPAPASSGEPARSMSPPVPLLSLRVAGLALIVAEACAQPAVVSGSAAAARAALALAGRQADERASEALEGRAAGWWTTLASAQGQFFQEASPARPAVFLGSFGPGPAAKLAGMPARLQNRRQAAFLEPGVVAASASRAPALSLAANQRTAGAAGRLARGAGAANDSPFSPSPDGMPGAGTFPAMALLTAGAVLALSYRRGF